MNSDSIQISTDLTLSQKKTYTDSIISWSLILSHTKHGDIELKHAKVVLNPIMGRNYSLYVPSLITAFKEKPNLVVFLYDSYLKIYMNVYQFPEGKKFTTKKYQIGELMPGSVDNFGGYRINIRKKKMGEDDYYFYMHAGRTVMGAYDSFFHYNLKTEKILSIGFKVKRQIQDTTKCFYSLDLDEGRNQVEEILKGFLIKEKQIGTTFKYLGYLDNFNSYCSNNNAHTRDSGCIYFFYQDSIFGSIKMISYDNEENQWLLGEYTEKEIKQEIDKTPSNEEGEEIK